MTTSAVDLSTARQLAAGGRHAELLAYLGGREECRAELRRSPSLALLFGTTQARLGHHAEGRSWIELALSLANESGDDTVKARALNGCGALALVVGKPVEAAEYFELGLKQPTILGNHVALGLCHGNLGIVRDLTGDYSAAIKEYSLAIEAYQTADHRCGVAEVRHNLSIAYRHRGNLQLALEEADRAIADAEIANELSLRAQALAGRAETRWLTGDEVRAQQEAQEALAIHTGLGDKLQEAEDRRILALTLAQSDFPIAERMLREVITLGDSSNRPLLAGFAGRDLACLLDVANRGEEARQVALTACECLEGAGALAEARKLTDRIPHIDIAEA